MLCILFWLPHIIQYIRICVFFYEFQEQITVFFTQLLLSKVISVNDESALQVNTERASPFLWMDLPDARYIFNLDFSGTRAIELAQENTLPGP